MLRQRKYTLADPPLPGLQEASHWVPFIYQTLSVHLCQALYKVQGSKGKWSKCGPTVSDLTVWWNGTLLAAQVLTEEKGVELERWCDDLPRKPDLSNPEPAIISLGLCHFTYSSQITLQNSRPSPLSRRVLHIRHLIFSNAIVFDIWMYVLIQCISLSANEIEHLSLCFVNSCSCPSPCFSGCLPFSYWLTGAPEIL